jgi:hypothetical protein
MPAPNVDLVFVIDSSSSMKPCFEGLVSHLNDVITPLQGLNLNVRLGLLAMGVGGGAGGDSLFDITTLTGDYKSIYQSDPKLFTTDRDQFSKALRNVKMQGDENHLIALDLALDFPFGPISNTRRVVALFSDERIEDGKISPDEIAIRGALIQKIQARKVMLFAALPDSPLLEDFGAVDGAQIERINGGDGLSSVDFSKLLQLMAKSISVCDIQGTEGTYEKGLFGQQLWGTGRGTFGGA